MNCILFLSQEQFVVKFDLRISMIEFILFIIYLSLLRLPPNDAGKKYECQFKKIIEMTPLSYDFCVVSDALELQVGAMHIAFYSFIFSLGNVVKITAMRI